MVKTLDILMYHNAFMQGDFVSAAKDTWNAMVSRCIIDADGGKKLDLEKAIQLINTNLDAEMGMLFYLYFLLKHSEEGRLEEFDKLGYAGETADLIDQLSYYLSNMTDTVEFINPSSQKIISEFQLMLINYPTGDNWEKIDKKCIECEGTGSFDEDRICLVCNGTGMVKGWENDGSEVTPEYLQGLQQFIQDNHKVLIRFAYDYLIYLLVTLVFENTADDGSLGCRQSGTQTTTDYMFRGEEIYGEMLGDFKGIAERQDVDLVIPFIGVEFKVPIHIINENKYKVPEPAPMPEPRPEQKPDEKTQKGHDKVTPEDEKAFGVVYTKRDRTKVVGYSSPKHIVFKKSYNIKEAFLCTNRINELVLYFSAEEYTRDEVRVAYSSLACVTKSDIKVLKITA